MPLLVTDGTTAREQRTGVVFAEGKITSAVTYIDLDWRAARTANYGYFTLDLQNVEFESDELAMWQLSAPNTPVTTGYYGGFYAYGEGDSDLDANTSHSMNSSSYFKLSANNNGAHLGRYYGNFTIYAIFSVDSSQTSGNTARISTYWKGTARLNAILGASISGGGVCTGGADYGLRFGTGGGSQTMSVGSYCLTGFKEGGQF
tara:strand:+ start:374 stop:982 length:609 start_codon:yes stop_codon:yes gene_type:complete